MTAVALQPVATATIVTPRGVATAVAREQVAIATAIAAQGPAGAPGKDGTAAPAAGDLIFTASSAISGHRAVFIQPDGSLAYGSTDLPASLDTIVGVTLGFAPANAPVTVRIGGEMIEPSWSWAVGPVWLGLDGNLTQVDPAGGIALLIGVAIDATRIVIDPQPAFRTV